jgi:hypothetical protein
MEHIKDFYALNERRVERFRRKYCLHPKAPVGCSKKFGAAHTIQRAMLEKHLAEKYHVLKFSMDVSPKLGAALFSPEEIGIHKATTFHGFCATHDNELFRPLETREFAFEEIQIALLGFRAFSHELYCKDAQLDLNTMMKDYMVERPALQSLDRLEYLVATQSAVQNARNNLTEAWRQFGNMVATGSTTDLQYYAIHFDDAPNYLSSVAFVPEWDFQGNQIQDLGFLKPFRGIAFSAWATGDNAVAVFCWHKAWDAICRPFINSLRAIEEAQLGNRILAMAFEVSENIVFRRSWWEGLSQRNKELIAKRVPSGLNSQDRERLCLADDGLDAIQSRVKMVLTNSDRT